MALTAWATIVLVIVVSGLVVAIFWSFSHYYRQASTMTGAQQVSHEQDAYMRQVRQRTHQFAYAESIFGSAGGGDGATTTRTSQVWSNANAMSPNPAMPAAAASTPRRSNSYGQSIQYSDQYYQQEKDGSRANYSAYEQQTDYYDPQSPYASNAYHEYAYEQQPKAAATTA